MRIALLFVALLLAPSAEAAALDCAKATAPQDKTICATPALQQLDQDLAAAYDGLAAGLSDAGVRQLRQDERARHAFIVEQCTASDAGCLSAAYTQGLASVGHFAEQPPGAALVPIERFRLVAGTPKTAVVSAYPRLDKPAEPWGLAFEQAARQAAADLEPEEPATDATIDYRTTYLADDLAAVVFELSTYPHGAAHGLSRQVAFTYLPSEKRGLLPSDLFESGTTWSGFLATTAFTALQDQAKSGNWELQIDGPGALERAVADPADWQIRPDGLALYFAPESIAAYVAGAHTVLVPWADLKPYLAATLPFKLPGA